MPNVPKISLRTSLDGHKDHINCLTISSGAQYLLSGGDDATVILWNLIDGTLEDIIRHPLNGPVCSLTWIKLNTPTHSEERNRTHNAFVFGCADGSLQIYTCPGNGMTGTMFISGTPGHHGAVEHIAFDPIHCRIASVGGGSVQVWDIDDTGNLRPLVTNPIRRPYVARNVHFCDMGDAIMIFYLESHEIMKFSILPWLQVWCKMIPTRIGYAALSNGERSVLVSNLSHGVDQYALPAFNRVKSFFHVVTKNPPLQVASALHDSWIVVGGEDGVVRVFDRETSSLLTALPHGDGTMVQAVTARDTGNGCIIVTASASASTNEYRIRIWSHPGGNRFKDSAVLAFIKSSSRKTMQFGIFKLVLFALLGLVALTSSTLVLEWAQQGESPYTKKLGQHIQRYIWLLSAITIEVPRLTLRAMATLAYELPRLDWSHQY